MKKLLTAALLALSSTVFAATLNPVQLLNPAGSTSGQAVVSTGASTAPAWGNVTATALAAQAANTVVGNFTGSSASPTAFAMPSCSTSTSALRYTSGTGFTCYANSASLTGATFTGALSISYGQPSLSYIDTNQINGLGRFRFISSANAFSLYRNTATAGDFSTSTQPLTFNSSDVATFLNRPVFGSATPWDSANLTPANYAPLASPALTGTPTAPTAAVGTNTTQLATTAFAQAVATSGQYTFTPTQTGGIVGTTTNNNANAGSVGEYQQGSATGTSLTTSTNTNSTSVSLTAGDWDVSVDNKFNIGSGATVTMAGSTVTLTSGGGSALGQSSMVQGITAGNAIGVLYVATPAFRVSLASTTTVYATGIAVFSGGTVTVDGLIRARRVR